MLYYNTIILFVYTLANVRVNEEDGYIYIFWINNLSGYPKYAQIL